MEKEKWFAFILRSTGAAVMWAWCVHQTRSLHSLAKLIVSCLTVWWIKKTDLKCTFVIIRIKTKMWLQKNYGEWIMRELKCMLCQIGHSSFLLHFFLPSFSWYSCFPCAGMTPRLGSVGSLWEFRQQTHKSRRLDRHSAVVRPLALCCRPRLQS